MISRAQKLQCLCTEKQAGVWVQYHDACERRIGNITNNLKYDCYRGGGDARDSWFNMSCIISSYTSRITAVALPT